VTVREKMEGYCSTGQSPQWAVVPVEEEESFYEYNFQGRYQNKHASSAAVCEHFIRPVF
jgi:hypothetical protein